MLVHNKLVQLIQSYGKSILDKNSSRLYWYVIMVRRYTAPFVLGLNFNALHSNVLESVFKHHTHTKST